MNDKSKTIMVRLDRDLYKQLQQIKLDTDAASVNDVIAEKFEVKYSCLVLVNSDGENVYVHSGFCNEKAVVPRDGIRFNLRLAISNYNLKPSEILSKYKLSQEQLVEFLVELATLELRDKAIEVDFDKDCFGGDE